MKPEQQAELNVRLNTAMMAFNDLLKLQKEIITSQEQEILVLKKQLAEKKPVG
jgi:hypothetical protein